MKRTIMIALDFNTEELIPAEGDVPTHLRENPIFWAGVLMGILADSRLEEAEEFMHRHNLRASWGTEERVQ